MPGLPFGDVPDEHRPLHDKQLNEQYGMILNDSDTAAALFDLLETTVRPRLNDGATQSGNDGAVMDWSGRLWRGACELHGVSPDALLEKFWRLKKGRPITRSEVEASEQVSADEASLRFDSMLDALLHRVVDTGDKNLEDVFWTLLEYRDHAALDPGDDARRAAFKAAEAETDVARIALTAEWLSESEDWAAEAASRALFLLMLAPRKLPVGGLKPILGELSRLYIDGHDHSVVIVARSVLEKVLTTKIPDALMAEHLQAPADEYSLAQRIELANRRRLLSNEGLQRAHRVRKSANDVLHGWDASRSLEALMAIRDCLFILAELT